MRVLRKKLLVGKNYYKLRRYENGKKILKNKMIKGYLQEIYIYKELTDRYRESLNRKLKY